VSEMRSRAWLVFSALALLFVAGLAATDRGEVTAANDPLPVRRAVALGCR
jgi:uncharacterized protein YaeQ